MLDSLSRCSIENEDCAHLPVGVVMRSISRCVYEQAPRNHRLTSRKASGILLLVFVHRHADIELSIGRLTGTVDPRIRDTSMALVAATATVNAILALLIVLRLLFHQRYMIKALGDEHTSPYPKIMNICVESCALIFITSIAGIGSLSTPRSNKYLIPMLLLPHVCVRDPHYAHRLSKLTFPKKGSLAPSHRLSRCAGSHRYFSAAFRIRSPSPIEQQQYSSDTLGTHSVRTPCIHT